MVPASFKLNRAISQRLKFFLLRGLRSSNFQEGSVLVSDCLVLSRKTRFLVFIDKLRNIFRKIRITVRKTKFLFISFILEPFQP